MSALKQEKEILFREKVKKSYSLIIICLFFIFYPSLFMPAYALTTSSEEKEAKVFLDNFFAIQTIEGQFTQIGPRGERTTGVFYMKRPGCMRFNYQNSNLEIISDGNSVGVHNKTLNHWDLYKLSQTPLKFLLDKSLNFSKTPIISLKRSGHNTLLTLQDKAANGAKLTLSFNNRTKMLDSWVVIDQQMLKTRVLLSNLKKGVSFEKDTFIIPYQDIAMQRPER